MDGWKEEGRVEGEKGGTVAVKSVGRGKGGKFEGKEDVREGS